MTARELDEFEAAVRNAAVDVMMRRRIGEMDLERERETVELHAAIRDAPAERRELMTAIVRAVCAPT